MIMEKAKEKINSLWWAFNSMTGLRGKIMGISVAVVMMLGGWITWQAHVTSTTVLQEQLEMRGISIARDVAARSVDAVFNNNLFELHQLVKDTLVNNEDIVYLFIADPHGDVLVHSFSGTGVPHELLSFNPVRGENRFHKLTFHSEKGLIHDIAVPVFDGRAGTVRLGMGEAGLKRIVADMTTSMLISVVTIFIAAILATYLLASLLKRPLESLIGGTQSVAAGDFSVRVEPWAGDELGQLAETFNLMTDKLRSYEEENRAARTELERKEKLRIQLVEKLISAQENERKRIARELHDETSQSLTSLKLGLKVIEGEQDRKKIHSVATELRKTLRHTLDEVSALARDLRPSVLDDLGLETALSRLVEKTAARLAKPVGFYQEGLEKARFPSYMETAVYRIIQEALTNVMKYAQADHISVVLHFHKGIFSAIVEDDGVGFSVADVLCGKDGRKGLGLFGMQERAVIIGGELEIESSPGEGTTIYLNVPAGGGESA